MIYKTYYPSSIGIITLASDGENLVGLWNENQKYYGASINETMIENNNLEVFEKAFKWLDDYFSGMKPDISLLPLAPNGNEFRKDVWKILCDVPYGKTITYGEIAKKIAQKKGLKSMSAQAIGGAVGHNPISIIIPCHRVVGSNNSLTGYAGGIDKKIKLLEIEGVDTSKLLIPKK
ncbi:methylated-DNA-[protein]-cysteine S-methyltransferase [Bacilli bacterium PM5-3]|nr:methylated-DNA-[protein]-cysteine S-methyltransferase [Bacilli bacterium PM5-3]MDH6603621.1 methylated-DNA-[protein]-cysteine S-methyltransferase [Bacilli bacterium PM5-9]